MSQNLHFAPESHPITLAAGSFPQVPAGGWVEERLHEQADVLAVAIMGYAVMSNHLHAVEQWKKSRPS